MKYEIRVSETGEFIDDFETLEEAKKVLVSYNKEDEAQGIYKEGYYEIVSKVTLFPTNEEVYIDEYETVNIEIPIEYKEAAVTNDSRVIAYDEAVAGWVELGRNN